MTMFTVKDRLFNGVFPAFLLAVCVGQIYAFTNFSTAISAHIGESKAAVQFAFSLGIFFLGMGAAFFGRIVEKDVRMAAVIGTALFIGGLLFANYGIDHKSLLHLYVGYGLLLGLGTGTIYITPVKTLMMWFPEHKAVAAAIPIVSFGLGSTFSTIAYNWVEPMGITKAFLVYAAIYLPLMAAGCVMLRKPGLRGTEAAFQDKETRGTESVRQKGVGESETESGRQQGFGYRRLLKDRFFQRSWVFMFLNISCGLMLIPLAKQMMGSAVVGYSAAVIAFIVGASGVLNGGGRLVFAAWSDCLKERRTILLWILGISVVTMSAAMLPCTIGAALLIINACYGAGFSVIPGILADHFGMDNISKIHGAVLSAWGVAGLVGNQVAILVSDKLGFGYYGVVVMLIALYAANMWNAAKLRRL